MQQMSVTPDMMQQQYNADMYAQQWPNQFAAAGLFRHEQCAQC
jgi:hypothetical protein